MCRWLSNAFLSHYSSPLCLLIVLWKGRIQASWSKPYLKVITVFIWFNFKLLNTPVNRVYFYNGIIKLCLCVMLGSPVSVSHGANRRLLVYKHCIPLCESGDLQTEVASDIIGLLMLEVTYLPYRWTQINSHISVQGLGW